jgi:hypothetical protein
METALLEHFHKYCDVVRVGYVQAFFPPQQALLAKDPGLGGTPA